MERTKKDFIKELLVQAQESTWKNELAKDYAIRFAPNEKERDEKVRACEHALKKDVEYIQFLKEQCEL